MITGRYNYTQYGKLLGLPLIDKPTLAADPVNAVSIAIAYWSEHGLNAFADKDDIETITRDASMAARTGWRHGRST